MRAHEIISEGINDPGIFKAVFMAGPPGAGKNTVIRQLGLTQAGLRMLDMDQVVGLLRQRRKEYNFTNQGYEKGLDLTKRRQALLQRQMLGMIINTTGRDYETTLAINEALRKAGYDTFMVFVSVSEEKAWKRAQNRQANATNPADVQRPVDKEYFDKAYPDTMRNMEFYALQFGSHFASVVNNEDREIKEDDEEETFATTMARTFKKVQRFLRAPLTPTAQHLVTNLRGNSAQST